MLINITNGIAATTPKGFALKSPHIALPINGSWINPMHILFGLDWSGLCIAGGFAFCLARGIRAPTDMDIFLYGDLQSIDTKANYVIQFLLDKLGKYPNIHNSITITRASCVIRIRSGSIFSADIILIRYPDIDSVLAGFDLDCCQIAFDGTNLWTTESGFEALSTSVMRIDPRKSSKKMAIRIVKYYQRGIGIYIDDSKIARLIREHADFSIYGARLKFTYCTSPDRSKILKSNAGIISRKKNKGYQILTDISEENMYGAFKSIDSEEKFKCIDYLPGNSRISPFIDATPEFWQASTVECSQQYYSET